MPKYVWRTTATLDGRQIAVAYASTDRRVLKDAVQLARSFPTAVVRVERRAVGTDNWVGAA